MSRTLYSRPALDVSMTHMEDDMMDVDEKFPSRAESDVEARARLLCARDAFVYTGES
jgi:hypothetical protein|tara:strand:+ start:32028 stop:32198 length:171 start_codon:yes stop_codon:yes gene_type:complete